MRGEIIPGLGMSAADEARLLQANEALVQKVARGLVGAESPLLDDVLQEGRVAMLELTRKFDASRGIPWGAYVAQGMRWEMIRWLKNCANTVRVPVHAFGKGVRALTVSLDKPVGEDEDGGTMRSVIQLRFSRDEPTREEINEQLGLGLSRERIRQIENNGLKILRKRLKGWGTEF